MRLTNTMVTSAVSAVYQTLLAAPATPTAPISYTYAATTGSQLAGGGVGNSPSGFRSIISGITNTFTIYIYAEVDATVTLNSDVRFRHLAGDGTVKLDVPLTSLVSLTPANTGKVRYRTQDGIVLMAGDTIHVQTRTAN